MACTSVSLPFSIRKRSILPSLWAHLSVRERQCRVRTTPHSAARLRERIREFPKKQRPNSDSRMIKTILSAVGLALAGGIFFMFTQPRYESVRAFEVQIGEYNQALQKAAELQQL